MDIDCHLLKEQLDRHRICIPYVSAKDERHKLLSVQRFLVNEKRAFKNNALISMSVQRFCICYKYTLRMDPSRKAQLSPIKST